MNISRGISRTLAVERAIRKMALVVIEGDEKYRFSSITQIMMDVATAENLQRFIFLMAVSEEYENVLPEVFLHFSEIASIIDYAALQATSEQEVGRVLNEAAKIIEGINAVVDTEQ